MTSSTAAYASLKGRAVLISGGASGIGAHMVREFAGQGARVTFLDIDANAAAALDLPLRALTADVGVDVLSFGGTKNGALAAEAVVFFDPARDAAVRFGRKQAMQLPSKMRFVAAQFEALLRDGLTLVIAGMMSTFSGPSRARAAGAGNRSPVQQPKARQS